MSAPTCLCHPLSPSCSNATTAGMGAAPLETLMGHHGSHQHLLGMSPAPSWLHRYYQTHPASCSNSSCYWEGSVCPVLASPVTSVCHQHSQGASGPQEQPSPGTSWHIQWVPGFPSPSSFLQLNNIIETLEEEAFWCGTLFSLCMLFLHRENDTIIAFN